ncbi:MAG: MarR family transcriptional regulator, partial [Cyclobacteriaceae bacterium]|nr:MarR family transcriptional regulator [Cyclobacteriaceae bacterium]
MDIFNHLGELALGSRLKRLSDQIMRHGARIYQANDMDFEPKWFPVFYLLSQDAPLGVTEMAQELGVTHAAVSQTVRELLQKKLITGVK